MIDCRGQGFEKISPNPENAANSYIVDGSLRTKSDSVENSGKSPKSRYKKSTHFHLFSFYMVIFPEL